MQRHGAVCLEGEVASHSCTKTATLAQATQQGSLNGRHVSIGDGGFVIVNDDV